MNKVERYQTIDGLLFEDYVKALEHENATLLAMVKKNTTVDEKSLRDIYCKVIDLPNGPGVYLLNNLKYDKKYVGSAISIRNRLYNFLAGGHHSNKTLADDRINSQLTDWEISVLENIKQEDICELEEKEKYYIELLKSYVPNGYNVVKPCRKNKDLEHAENNYSTTMSKHLLHEKFTSIEHKAHRLGYEVAFNEKELDTFLCNANPPARWRIDFTLSLLLQNRVTKTVEISDLCFIPDFLERNSLFYKNELYSVKRVPNQDDTEWYYSYTCNKKQYEERGFKTYDDAVLGFTKSRLERIREFAENEKENLSDEIYRKLTSINPENYMTVLYVTYKKAA